MLRDVGLSFPRHHAVLDVKLEPILADLDFASFARMVASNWVSLTLPATGFAVVVVEGAPPGDPGTARRLVPIRIKQDRAA